jgi:uncharacterized membrane protein
MCVFVQVWLNIRSDAKLSSDKSCWSSEGRVAYCYNSGSKVPVSYTCAAPPTPVIKQSAANSNSTCSSVEIPWYENGYTVKGYSASQVTSDLHAWPRLKGNNDWTTHSSYYINTAWAALPFAIIGVLMGLILIPCGCRGARKAANGGRRKTAPLTNTELRRSFNMYRTRTFIVFAVAAVCTVIAAIIAIAGVRGMDDSLVKG